jgi:hypothetical protein
MYICRSCGGVVIAWARNQDGTIEGVLPERDELSEVIPNTARRFLSQAQDT